MDVNTQKSCNQLLREPQTRAILVLPVLIRCSVPLPPRLEVTNATIAIYNEDNGKHSVNLPSPLPARRYPHVLLLNSPQESSRLSIRKSAAGALPGGFLAESGYLPACADATHS